MKLAKFALTLPIAAITAMFACVAFGGTVINVPGDQATIAAALAAAKSEDEVVVAAGDYTLSAGLTVPAGVTVRGATGDPADVRVSGNYDKFSVFTLSDDGAEVKDLSIVKARGADNKPGAAAYLTAGTLRNCVISGGELGPRTQGFLYVAGANALATGCVITNNLTGGRGDFDATNGGVVYLTNGTIEDSYIGYNSLCRTYYYTYALPDGPVKVTGGTLRNCVVHKNMMPVRGGVWATGGSVQDCVIWNNSNPYSTASDHLDVWDGTASKFTGCKARVAINANCEAVDVMPPTDWFGFGMSESSGIGSLEVSFQAHAGAGSYTWDFGDGSPAETTDGETVMHTYEQVGVYAPTVTYGGKTYAAPEKVHVFGSPHSVSTYDDLVETVDNAVDGLEVHIATGEYIPTKMLCVFNGVKFVGAGTEGVGATVFNGNQNGKRVFNLNHPDAWVQDIAFRNFQVAMRGAGVTAAVFAGTVSNCVVRSSKFTESANKIASQMSVGGGSGPALVTHCVFSNLTSNCKNAIGVAIAVKVEANGSLENSLVTDCHGSSVRNCYPVWAAGGTVRNCTVANNTGCEVGGVHAWTQGNLYDAENPGAAAGWVYNTVVAANSSYSQTARNDVHPGSEARFVNCATAGETALNETCQAATTAKLFNDFAKADYTPAPDSPLIDNGATVENPPELDLRGTDRVQGKAIDIGCYEMDASAVVLSFTPEPESVFLGEPIVFKGTLTGIDDQSGFTWEWDFDNDGTPDYVGGPVATNVFATYGAQTVTLTVTDANGASVGTKTRENVAFVNPKVLYVKKDNPTPQAPYESWEHAATTVDAAYAAAAEHAEIVVSNGTYTLAADLTIEKAVRIRSLARRADDVTLFGAGSTEQSYVIQLKNPEAVVEALTVDGQVKRNCVYIWGAGGMVTNSVIRNGYSHQAEFYIPGCFIGGEAGVLSHCIVTNCNRDREGMRPNDGMIANSGRISNCLIAGNRSVLNVEAQDTEALIYNSGIIENCTIVNNSYTNGLFLYQSSAGVLKNTILADNWEIGDGTKASPVTGSGTVKNNVVDPDSEETFVDAANGDWHLVPRSPAVSAGERRPGPLPQVDLDGNPRLFGGLDAGCYESVHMPGLLLLVR